MYVLRSTDAASRPRWVLLSDAGCCLSLSELLNASQLPAGTSRSQHGSNITDGLSLGTPQPAGHIRYHDPFHHSDTKIVHTHAHTHTHTHTHTHARHWTCLRWKLSWRFLVQKLGSAWRWSSFYGNMFEAKLLTSFHSKRKKMAAWSATQHLKLSHRHTRLGPHSKFDIIITIITIILQ